MSELKFEILSLRSAVVDGTQDLDINCTTIRNGYMVRTGVTGGSVGVSTGSPIGVAYDRQPLEEYPQSLNLATLLAGKKMAYATGMFYALVGKSLFKSGALPAAGAKVYPGGNGKYAETGGGSGVVGIVMDANRTVQNEAGARTVALVKFNFSPIV